MTDTRPEAQAVLLASYRGQSPARKWAAVAGAYRFARTLHAAGVRQRHPGATPAEVRADWCRLHFESAPWFAAAEELPVAADAEQQTALIAVLDAFAALGVACAVGGSVASSLYGVPRFTQAVDLTAEPFPGRESAFAGHFGTDYYLSLAAVLEAVRQRGSFNIIHTSTGAKVDVFVAADRPFAAAALARREVRTDLDPAGRPVPLLRAEDVVLHKLEWYRLGGETSDRRWGDILGVLRVQAGRLDEAYLDRWAADLGVADLLAKARAEG